jgi:hypothetical protein
MKTPERSDEIGFNEFRELILSIPPFSSVVPAEFTRLLRSGCSEAEAKRWLALHIWDFPQPLRDEIVMTFLADAVQRAAESPRPQLTEAEIRREFMRIWTREGFSAANTWYATCIQSGGRA